MNYLKSLAFGQYESEVKPCECDGSSSGGGALVVKITVTEDGSNTIYTMDHTWQEIYDAGNCIVVYDHSSEDAAGEYELRDIYHIDRYTNVSGRTYAINTHTVARVENTDDYINMYFIFDANSPDDYPSYTNGGTV